MKKKRLLFLFWLLMAALCMPLAGCGDDEEEKSIPEGRREMQKETFEFSAFKKYGTYLIGYSSSQTYINCIWSAEGAGFSVYLYQDGKFQIVGSAISSKETSLNDEQRTGGLTYEVPIPTNIDPSRKYGVIAFTNNIESSLVNNTISCNADLIRNTYLYIWDDDTHDVGGDNRGDSGRPIYRSRPLMTIEGLSIYNYTTDTITVRHKGFDVAEKWYYTKATVNMSCDLSIRTNGTSTEGEVISDVRKVAPNERFYMSSKYVPTGKKMKDARLVLEINGKEVKTDAISSDVEIKYGEYYAMKVKWDGEKLEWIMDADNNK